MSNQLPIDDKSELEPASKKYTALVLVIIAALTILDIAVDLFQGVEATHIAIEAIIIPLVGIALYFVWRGSSRLQDENFLLKTDLARVSAAAEAWKSEAGRFVKGLSDAIDSQFTRWNLSKAEKEIALLLLKGLSHKEIATSRETSERTARQQALAVYEKSGLAGRAELAAFFLEDLFAPSQKK